MSEGAAFEAFIARVRACARLPELAARKAAPYVQAAARATAAAGTTPDGKAWPARKDGGRALADAASAVTARAFGSVVQIALTGVYVLHHIGHGHAPQRSIIPHPGEGAPPSIRAAIIRGIRDAFAETMKGGR